MKKGCIFSSYFLLKNTFFQIFQYPFPEFDIHKNLSRWKHFFAEINQSWNFWIRNIPSGNPGFNHPIQMFRTFSSLNWIIANKKYFKKKKKSKRITQKEDDLMAATKRYQIWKHFCFDLLANQKLFCQCDQIGQHFAI